MSARKLESIGSLQDQRHCGSAPGALTLSPDAVVIHKSGIEFRSDTAFPVGGNDGDAALAARRCEGALQCVVVDCTGTKHTGYHSPCCSPSVQTGGGPTERNGVFVVKLSSSEAGSRFHRAEPSVVRLCFFADQVR